MIIAFFGFILLIAQYYMRNKEWEFTELIRYMLIFSGIVFVGHDTYYYLIVGSEISNFYNAGAGLTIGNQTFFSSNDTKLAYFAGKVANDYVFMDMLFMGVLWGLPIVFLLYVLDWAGKHNFLLDRMPETRRHDLVENIRGNNTKRNGD